MSEQSIRQFVDLLWPPDCRSRLDDEWRFSLWEMPGKKSYHYRLSDPDLEIAAHALDREGHNVFCGIGLRSRDFGPYERGKKEDVVALPGFWCDIDIRGEGHKADNLPANIIDVVKGILEPFDWDPTAVVGSGGGIHAYWLFDQPLLITDENRKTIEELSRAFQERLALGARACGWQFDLTADLPRVLRPVGTFNRKHDPIPVEFMGTRTTRYPYSLFEKALQTKSSGIASMLGRESNTVAPASATPAPSKNPQAPIDRRSSETILEELKAKMIKCRRHDRQEVFEKILNGEPFAGPGERDKMLQKVASWLAFYDCIADPEILADILVPSLEAMEEMEPNGAMTVDDAIEKITRAQGDARRKTAISAEVEQRIAKGLTKEARRSFTRTAKPAALASVPDKALQIVPPRKDFAPAGQPALQLLIQIADAKASDPNATKNDGRYSFEEIASFAAKQTEISGIEVMPEAFIRRWVILYGDALFIHRNGRYQSPIPIRNFLQYAKLDLFPLLPEFDLQGRYYFLHTTRKSDGELRDKRTDEVLKEIATGARFLVGDTSLEESYFDPTTETYYEAVCPLRSDLTARFDPQIDKWLRLLSGTAPNGQDTEKLLDWIATLTFLKAPSCGLFLSGPPNTGKSMLANGLARLWHTGGYTRMEDVVGSFNGDVARCPLVVADESLPEGPNGKPISTKRLRDIISADTRPLKRKFMANTSLTGTIRCMFLANSEKLLDLGDETMGADSLEAVASRFLHIITTPSASEFINALGGRHGGTRDWVSGDLIARHALWLRDNRKVTAAGRFWVQGYVSSMHELLATSSTVNGLVVEWIVRFLSDPKPMVKAAFGVLWGNGELWVNTNIISEFWQEYIKNRLQTPPVPKLNMALQSLSKDKETTRISTIKGRRRFWALRVGTLLEWAKENGIGDTDELLQMINAPRTAEFEILEK